MSIHPQIIQIFVVKSPEKSIQLYTHINSLQRKSLPVLCVSHPLNKQAQLVW